MMSPTLGLDYAPHIDRTLLADVERVGRASGTALSRLELIGQDETTSHAFVFAAATHTLPRFFDNVDWDHLDAMLRQRLAARRPMVEVME